MNFKQYLLMYNVYIFQTYAPTALASARDFWTLRYTIVLEDGSLVVNCSLQPYNTENQFIFLVVLILLNVWLLAQICERSLTPSTGGPTYPLAQNFLRAEMLPSGYLIRPCDGGSVICIVDHIDLDVSK